MTANNHTWFVTFDGAESGPLTPATLRGYVESGKVSAETLVRRSDMKQPVPAQQIKGLIPANNGRANSDQPESGKAMQVELTPMQMALAAAAIFGAFILLIAANYFFGNSSPAPLTSDSKSVTSGSAPASHAKPFANDISGFEQALPILKSSGRSESTGMDGRIHYTWKDVSIATRKNSLVLTDIDGDKIPESGMVVLDWDYEGGRLEKSAFFEATAFSFKAICAASGIELEMGPYAHWLTSVAEGKTSQPKIYGEITVYPTRKTFGSSGSVVVLGLNQPYSEN